MASRDEPVRLYSSDDRRALSSSVSQLQELLEGEEEVLLAGNSGVADWAAYQRRCGKVEAYRNAIAIFKAMMEKAQGT